METVIVVMRAVVALVALLSASCIAAPRTEFMRSNGTMVYALSCDAMSECAAQAREVCPQGHDIVPGASGAGHTTARAGIGDNAETRMLIECKTASP